MRNLMCILSFVCLIPLSYSLSLQERIKATPVVVYHYDSNLFKILDLRVPVIRIAANKKTNTIYAVVVNPDFQIVKVDI